MTHPQPPYGEAREERPPQEQWPTYIFIRKEGFYLTQYPNDAEAAKGHELNPGTLRIETLDGKILWQLQ